MGNPPSPRLEALGYNLRAAGVRPAPTRQVREPRAAGRMRKCAGRCLRRRCGSRRPDQLKARAAREPLGERTHQRPPQGRRDTISRSNRLALGANGHQQAWGQGRCFRPSQHQSLQFQQLAKLYPRQARKPAMRQRGEQNSVVERCALRGAPQTGQVRPARAAGTVRTRNQRFSAARHKQLTLRPF